MRTARRQADAVPTQTARSSSGPFRRVTVAASAPGSGALYAVDVKSLHVQDALLCDTGAIQSLLRNRSAHSIRGGCGCPSARRIDQRGDLRPRQPPHDMSTWTAAGVPPSESAGWKLTAS